ncbi:transmembrane and coiled-coil domain-containing protein 6 [Cyprinodon tularosa]|uniref:transmembrane and coiled-coil domain-containing protein 6 n=1 Tax=Cyprinodon tularosa TaxID=77115 RepID=UPI0018E23157|nr:transmembrane and coiled-coil domain-containing protein 6 [Cyprinodon tularosa]
MWRLNKVRYKTGQHAESLEEFRLRRREKERALRQARRDRQLVSKRLLLNQDENEEHDTMEITPGELDVVSLFQKLQQSGTEKEAYIRTLSKALRDPSAQLIFIKLENSIHLLVSLLTGSDAWCRLQAVRCLHELSHSPHPGVATACLPATPYLLTYLSGQSTKFTELCLYTLGNICPESEVVKERLLAQGIIPALGSCIQTQRHNLAVVEAAGFTLFQLLQSKDAIQKVIPMVLASSLPSLLLSVLTPDPEFGLAPAIECAWCLHSLTSSTEDHSRLLAEGALRHCSSLLVSLGGAVGKENVDQEVELLVCPLLRCVGNLLSSCPAEALGSQLRDAQLVAPLCGLLFAFLNTQPALAREAAWVLNNLTAHSTDCCSALLTFHLVPRLIDLLPFSQGINTMVLRVLANVAHKNKEFCIQLAELGLLSALTATLKMADQDMVTLSLEVLFMMVASSPMIVEQFVRQGGLSVLEAIQYNSEGEVRRRATFLLEQHILT